MAQFIASVKKAPIAPKVLRELGLKTNWYEAIPKQYVWSVKIKARQYREVLKELSRY